VDRIRLRCLIAGLVLYSCAPFATPTPLRAATQAALPASVEHQIKASFVYTVTKFVDWPEAADPAKPLVFGVLGDEPFTAALQDAVAGKTVHGRTILVRRIQRTEELEGCDVLYVEGAQAGRWPEVSKALGASSILTLGETEGFVRSGGIIHLRLSEQMVRFEVNIDAARRAGLSISSRILELGKVVKDRRGSRMESHASVP